MSTLEVSAQILFDDVDFSPDIRQFGVYLQDELAGRFRVRAINDNTDLEVSRFSLDKNIRFSPRNHLSLLYFMFAQSLDYDKVMVTCFLQDEPYYERLGGFVLERFLNLTILIFLLNLLGLFGISFRETPLCRNWRARYVNA